MKTDEETTLTGYVRLKDLAALVTEAPEEEQPVRSIRVVSTLDEAGTVTVGTEVTLTAELEGFLENDRYEIQWQYTPDGGETVLNAENANGLTYSYIVDKTNFTYGWRLMVILASDGETAE